MTKDIGPGIGICVDRATLGANLRARRQLARLSQQQLANLLGEPQPNVTRWERGTMEIPGSLIPDIAEALGITPDDLFADPPPVDVELPKPGPRPRHDAGEPAEPPRRKRRKGDDAN